jgi:hypothetical protein
MPEVLKSLASWRQSHGFGILCILRPLGERFVIVRSNEAPPSVQAIPSWPGISEADLRKHLQQNGLSDAEVDEAIRLSRLWATRVTQG